MANPFAEIESPCKEVNPFSEDTDTGVETAEQPLEPLTEVCDPLDDPKIQPPSPGFVEGTSVCSEDAPPSSSSRFESSDKPLSSFQNAEECAVCKSALGKRWVRPRHHCRICASSVCATCSPSTVQMEGEGSMQRACKSCIQHLPKLPELKERLSRLDSILQSITSPDREGVEEVQSHFTSLEGSLAGCEESVGALEDLRDSFRAAKTRLAALKVHAEAAEARAAEERQAREAFEAKAAQQQRAREAVEAELRMQKEVCQDLRGREAALSALASKAEVELAKERKSLFELQLEKAALELKSREEQPIPMQRLTGVDTLSSSSFTSGILREQLLSELDARPRHDLCWERCRKDCTIS